MDAQQLDAVRHSAAHMLAAAVLELYPGTKLAIGPTVENGFYYDFKFPEGVTISDSDLPAIEKKMKHIIKGNHKFIGKEVTVEQAKEFEKDQPFKLELINEFAKDGKNLTLYESGPFTDLCRGGHAENTNQIPADGIKLQKLAGAYWRGDEKNPMLTRIYGLLFATKEELDAYLHQIEEAKKRDHRKLGQELDLFVISDLVGTGLPLFTPNGTILRDALSDFLWQLNKKAGYLKVDIPHLAKPDLYKTSGHWDKYKDDGFQVHGRDKHFMLKPMNCPHHTQIYGSRARSYRDLPLRYFEVTKVYRDEQSGELMGLSRVLSITQDDGHIFCRPDQIGEEAAKIVGIIKDFYTALGMFKENSYWARLSVRDPKTPEKYLGDHAVWDMAEKRLEEIGNEHKLNMVRGEGEAAFYGPKLDFMFKDAIGREWQLATIQLDFVQPERFQLGYTDQGGNKVRPVMIHRAISGSLERFLSVMIEHFAGAFPVWLSPVQVHLAPVSAKHVDGARALKLELEEQGIRVDIDEADETVGKKIRNAAAKKPPYIVVVGDKELAGEEWMIRVRGQEEQIKLSKGDFIAKVLKEIKERV